MTKQIIYTKNAPEPIGPYSQAVLKGDILYVSGQIAINPESGELMTMDITLETQQVMKNLHMVLARAGMDFNDVVKCSIFVKDMNNFQKINEEYGKSFPSNPPARETVEVSRLPKDANVEISCIAVK